MAVAVHVADTVMMMGVGIGIDMMRYEIDPKPIITTVGMRVASMNCLIE